MLGTDKGYNTAIARDVVTPTGDGMALRYFRAMAVLCMSTVLPPATGGSFIRYMSAGLTNWGSGSTVWGVHGTKFLLILWGG